MISYLERRYSTASKQVRDAFTLRARTNAITNLSLVEEMAYENIMTRESMNDIKYYSEDTKSMNKSFDIGEKRYLPGILGLLSTGFSLCLALSSDVGDNSAASGKWVMCRLIRANARG